MKLIRNRALQEMCLLLLGSGLLAHYALTGYSAAFNKDWTQSPYLFVLVVAGVLLLPALALGLQGVRQLRGGETAAVPKVPGGPVRVAGAAGLCLAYYAALRFVTLPYLACRLGPLTLRFSTFELASLVFLAAMMLFMGVRKKAVLALVPLGATAFLSVMFRSLLHVILP